MLDSRNHFLPQRRVTRILHLQGTAISSPTPAHFILTVEQNDNACKKPRLTQKIMKPFEGADPAMMAPFWHFGGFRKLLDVGGGSGAFDIERCRRYPNLSVMVYDLPFVTDCSG